MIGYKSAAARGGRAVIVATLACMLGLVSGAAHAVATYSASISSTVTITGFDDGSGLSPALPGGLFFYDDGSGVVPDAPDRATFEALFDTPLELSGAFASGSGTTGKSGSVTVSGDPMALGGGDTLVQSASTSGGAGPGVGESIARQLTNGFLTLENTTAGAITVYFAVEYSWAIAASVADTASEFAGAYASIFNHVWDPFVDDNAPGGFADPLLAQFVVNEFFETGPGTSFSDSGTGTTGTLLFTVAAGQTVFFDIFADVTGIADVAEVIIPEPAAAGLFGLMLAALGFARRRRPRAA